jgi:hypothetical protein
MHDMKLGWTTNSMGELASIQECHNMDRAIHHRVTDLSVVYANYYRGRFS